VKIKTTDPIATKNALASVLVLEPQGTNLVAASTSVCSRVEDITGGIVPPTQYIPPFPLYEKLQALLFGVVGQTYQSLETACDAVTSLPPNNLYQTIGQIPNPTRPVTYRWAFAVATAQISSLSLYYGYWRYLTTSGTATCVIRHTTTRPTSGAGFRTGSIVASHTINSNTIQRTTINLLPFLLPGQTWFSFSCSVVPNAYPSNGQWLIYPMTVTINGTPTPINPPV
jgi:hypothetical protein